MRTETTKGAGRQGQKQRGQRGTTYGKRGFERAWATGEIARTRAKVGWKARWLGSSAGRWSVKPPARTRSKKRADARRIARHATPNKKTPARTKARQTEHRKQGTDQRPEESPRERRAARETRTRQTATTWPTATLGQTCREEKTQPVALASGWCSWLEWLVATDDR